MMRHILAVALALTLLASGCLSPARPGPEPEDSPQPSPTTTRASEGGPPGAAPGETCDVTAEERASMERRNTTFSGGADFRADGGTGSTYINARNSLTLPCNPVRLSITASWDETASAPGPWRLTLAFCLSADGPETASAPAQMILEEAQLANASGACAVDMASTGPTAPAGYWYATWSWQATVEYLVRPGNATA